MQKKIVAFSLGLFIAAVAAAQAPKQFQGQGPIQAISTESRPVQKQWKGTFSFPTGEVYFDNNFDGARLNGLLQVNDSTYTALITAENTPVNESPWYAFKVWAKSARHITIKLTYPQGVKHRYAPKISHNGTTWASLEPADAKKEFELDTIPVEYTFHLEIGPKATWVAAQELSTSAVIKQWSDGIAKKPGVTATTIGHSTWGKPITLLKIGNPASRNRILVIGRQHPPEVTGTLAQEAFIEEILGNKELASTFREKFLVYVVPLMNPDGVDGGFWRHNAGGIDLNRDWAAFHQPETRAVHDFLQKELSDGNSKLWFGLDFHSTHDDIFYIVDPKLTGLLPGFNQEWLGQLKERIPGYTPNIKPLYSEGPTSTSFSYLFKTYGTEASVYEIGDKTSREFILQKSQVAADAMMELLLKSSSIKNK